METVTQQEAEPVMDMNRQMAPLGAEAGIA